MIFLLRSKSLLRLGKVNAQKPDPGFQFSPKVQISIQSDDPVPLGKLRSDVRHLEEWKLFKNPRCKIT